MSNIDKAREYRKKPVVIEAMEYTGHNGHQLNNWSNGKIIESPVLEPDDENPTGAYVQVYTLEGVMIGNVGDFIIKGIKGEFYPCKPDIFELTYEPGNQATDKDREIEQLKSQLQAMREAMEKIANLLSGEPSEENATESWLIANNTLTTNK